MVYYSLIKYVSLMFELVARRIRLLDQLPCGATRKHRERELDVVIQQHYLALRCAELLEELISPILLAQFLGCVLVWCLLILYITMNIDNMGAINTLILCEVLAFEMLAFSFLGSELTHVSYGISDEIYSFRWYDAPISVQKKAMLISARSQKIVGVTAFKFYFVSIEQFGKAVQTTYSFYLVMKNLFNG
ncbi:odorant receptor 85b-like isoform X2 [Topomyia yanbarensis]|uniref:odorant receptor 85b-like isoform X2 n=1 Tax=Topomyia yanbarensis TaxID=2498891 RepID=UPI00273C6DFD|nr:odorant receptor 85b-like isoform X2 [Topomyia yanbarensis]